MNRHSDNLATSAISSWLADYGFVFFWTYWFSLGFLALIQFNRPFIGGALCAALVALRAASRHKHRSPYWFLCGIPGVLFLGWAASHLVGRLA